MPVMNAEAYEQRVSIRQLQRNAAEFFDRARRGENFVVTRRGEAIGRIVPPDPVEEAISGAIADGVLDSDALAELPSTAEFLDGPMDPSPPGTRLGSEAISELREELSDR